MFNLCTIEKRRRIQHIILLLLINIYVLNTLWIFNLKMYDVACNYNKKTFLSAKFYNKNGM